MIPIFNYSIAYDVGNREPLFYETSPGSIVDISQLQLMLNKAAIYGYRNAGFILDRGYFSRENIRYMDHLGYDFVIMVKGRKAFVNEKIREALGSFEEKRQYTIRHYQVNGTTVKTKVFYCFLQDLNTKKCRVLSQKLHREIPHFCSCSQRRFHAGDMSLQTYFGYQLQICNTGLIGSVS